MTTKITKEFLKETIKNVLLEKMTDEEFVAYAQRLKAAKSTQAYKDAVARIQKKKEMAAAKDAEPSKAEKGLMSYFADTIKEEDGIGPDTSIDVEDIPASKPEKKDNKFMSGLRSWASSFVKEADESTLREVFGDLIKEAELEETPTKAPTKVPSASTEAPTKVKHKPGEAKTEKEYVEQDARDLENMFAQQRKASASELAVKLKEGGCSSSHAPGKRCEECGYMEESDTIEEGGCGKCGTPECTCKVNENEELEEKAKPMVDEPEGQDLNKDGKKGYGKVPAWLKKESIQTPEQENTLYENRFAPRNTRLFEKLVKDWTK